MKTRTLAAILLLGLSGLAAIPASRAADDEMTEMTDEQAVQALRDLGLPPQAVLEMLKNELRNSMAGKTNESQPEAQAPATVEQSVAATNTATTALTGTVLIQSASPVTVVSAPQIATVQDFRDHLAPYGTWIQVDPYGTVWQPATTMVDILWRPYVHDGCWEWTDDGWYWRSEYTWGWGPFHYGRWVFLPRHRWVWVPDIVWGPSWVQWRYSDAYVGWAPLPPEASYEVGFGFRYNGLYASFDCEFGLSHAHYSFVPTDCMHRRQLHQVVVRGEKHHCDVYEHTKVVHETYTSRNNVTVPALPRRAVANAGRRTTSLQQIASRARIVNDAVTASLRAPAPVSAPAPLVTAAPATPIVNNRTPRRISIADIRNPAPVTSTPAPVQAAAPAGNGKPDYWPSPGGSGSRASAINTIIRQNTLKTAPKTVAPAASAVRMAEPVRQPTTIVAPAPAPRAPTMAFRTPPAVNPVPPATAVSSQPKTTVKSVASAGNTESEARNDGGSRGSRFESLVRNKLARN